MAATKLQPLTWNIPIVDAKGCPTPEFMRKWAQQFGINGTIPLLSTALQVSAVLDVLGATSGSLLYRGASVWGGLASPSDATKFLNGAATPGYANVKDSDLSTSDVATNNVATTKHGFAPKLPNDATKYLDGTGNYTVPAGGGGGGGAPAFGLQNITVSTSPQTLANNAAANILAYLNFGGGTMTVVMPPGPYDGQTVILQNSAGGLVNITVHANTGQTIAGAPSGHLMFNEGEYYLWIWFATLGRWVAPNPHD